MTLTRRSTLKLGGAALGALALPRFAIAQGDNRPSITIAVQKIMRHADVRTTAETYTHLTDDYLRTEIDRLRLPQTAEPTKLVTTLLPPARAATGRQRATPPTASNSSSTRCARHDSNVRPSGSKPDALSN